MKALDDQEERLLDALISDLRALERAIPVIITALGLERARRRREAASR